MNLDGKLLMGGENAHSAHHLQFMRHSQMQMTDFWNCSFGARQVKLAIYGESICKVANGDLIYMFPM